MDLKSFLAPELLAEYMSYNVKQQLYTKFRGVGLAMEVAWVKAGFPQKNARPNASSFEKNHPLIKDIIKTLQTRAKLNGLGKENSVISKEIANNALQGRTGHCDTPEKGDLPRRRYGRQAVQCRLFQGIRAE